MRFLGRWMMVPATGSVSTFPSGTPKPKLLNLDAHALLAALEAAFEIPPIEICGPGKAPRIMQAKETLIKCGHRLGANMAELARPTGLNISIIGSGQFEIVPHA